MTTVFSEPRFILFVVKLIRSQLRQRMFPGTLEMLLFLKSNRTLWSVLDVEAALNSWTGEDLIVNDIEEDSE